MAPPAPAAEKKIVLDDPSVAPPLEAVAETVPEPVVPVAEAAVATATGPTEVAAEVRSDVPSATSPYAHRNAPDRLEYAEQHGGSVETEAAVAAALEWLAEAQSADGRWDASRFGAGQELVVLGQDRGGAGADADSGISALAILAFLGAGHSHQQGDYQANVAKGLEFLMRCQMCGRTPVGRDQLVRANVLPFDGVVRAGGGFGDDRRQAAGAGRASGGRLLVTSAASFDGRLEIQRRRHR